MEPVSWTQPFNDSEWVFQVKWDGVRCLAEVNGSGTTLYTRRGRERTANYPEVAAALARPELAGVHLDGELVAMDETGRPSFPRILRRDLGKSARLAIPVVYLVFDLLARRGEDLRSRPWEERQDCLAGLELPLPLVRRVENVAGPGGEELYGRCRSLGMEGIVGKQRLSAYRAGKSGLWRKVKVWREQAASPFYWVPATFPGRPHWTQPSLTVRVRYLEWTPGMLLRSPTLLGPAEEGAPCGRF